MRAIKVGSAENPPQPERPAEPVMDGSISFTIGANNESRVYFALFNFKWPILKF